MKLLFLFLAALFDQVVDHRGEDDFHREAHLAARHHDGVAARHEGVLDHAEQELEVLFLRIAEANHDEAFIRRRNIARDEWATIPVAIQARKPVPIAENHLEAGVTYLTDLQFLRQRNPTVLAPGEHTLTINVRPNRDDPVKGTFRLVVPEVGSDVPLAIELLPSKG